MTIWGHTHVHVEKDPEKREWRVSTAKEPHQLLVKIPWSDAFRTFEHAKDYSEAVATCQSHPTTALTRAEARSVRAEMERTSGAIDAASSTPSDPKVVSISEYKKRKR